MAAKSIMIQGTASNAGKSLLTAALCRIFKQDGYKVAPFKSQNMGLNSFITFEGFEMSRAQVMQAEACMIKPDSRMNPILLKPTGEKTSQVVVNGVRTGEMSASDYFEHKHNLVKDILNSYNSLAQENDIIVIEGAGSPAEINLKQNDIVNMGMAKLAGAPVILAGDIDRGGVFAALAGTLLLLNDEEREFVKGVIINKFRGDRNILKPGEKMLEDIIKRPVLGVVPYIDVVIDDEDSLSGRLDIKHTNSLIDIAVIRLPRMANFTDFMPLEIPGVVGVRYVQSLREFGNPAFVIIPGTSNMLGDLEWIKQSGLEGEILKYASKGGVVVGISQGMRMMGKNLQTKGGHISGLDLFSSDFNECRGEFTQIRGSVPDLEGVFEGISGYEYCGYGSGTEIYNLGNVYGIMAHGFFDNENIRKEVISSLANIKKICLSSNTFDSDSFKQEQYNKLAAAVRENTDINAVYKILEQGV